MNVDIYISYNDMESMRNRQKAIKITLFCALIFLITVISMCVNFHASKVNINGISIDTELADTPQKWEKGLMGRHELPANSGMLFVFPDENKRSFWMKNTFLPLDIIFISSGMKIVDIKKNFSPCKSILCATYTSKEAAMYALEVNANFTDENNISIGDAVKFS